MSGFGVWARPRALADFRYSQAYFRKPVGVVSRSVRSASFTTERRHLMPMNVLHQRRCSSAGWAKVVRDDLLPWALADVELGDQTLEIGPGYGATLRALVDRAGTVTAVEVDKP